MGNNLESKTPIIFTVDGLSVGRLIATEIEFEPQPDDPPEQLRLPGSASFTVRLSLWSRLRLAWMSWLARRRAKKDPWRVVNIICRMEETNDETD